jgi:hypothetical protein
MPQNCTSGSFLGLFCIHKYTSIIVLTPFRFLGKHPKENIEALDVYWWVTYDDAIRDIPRKVENSLLMKHLSIYGRLPKWNKSL